MSKLIIDHLTIGYRRHIVSGPLSGCFHDHGLTCLIGRNGLGKSTLLRTMAGIQPSFGGNILWESDKTMKPLTVNDMPRDRVARLVSVVLTEKIDALNLTAREVVGMGRLPYTGFFGRLTPGDERIIDQAMTLTGTLPFARRDITTLSDGERQKVMIARAIAQQTPVILLDEPTAFLDYESKSATLSLLRSIAHDMGKIVVASTHDLDIALRYADRFVTLTSNLKDVTANELREEITSSETF